MDNQIQNQRPTDEIDLLELFSRIGLGIKKFSYWILELIRSFFLLLIRKSIWILSFSLIGGFVGYYFYNTTPRFYSSEMVARSNSMNNSVIVNSINLLNDLFENKNYNALSSYLGTSSKEAEKIRSIEAFYGIDINKDIIADYIDYNKTYNPKDTTQKRLSDVFYLRISVYDESIFSNVRDGIKKYISTNPFILQNNEVRIQQTKSMITEYQSEINKLDSLQKVQYFEVPKMQKGGNSQMIVLNEKEAKLYHNDILSLYNRKLSLEKELVLNPDPITIIQDFTQLSKAENPLIKFLKTWILVFAIFGLLSSLIWQLRTKIWYLIKNQ
ncbi:MAG: hypothetical protein HOO91_20300 [Bacteroidales bacterium]|nr:hypothetical protein [Bacteroidales bacterium]